MSLADRLTALDHWLRDNAPAAHASLAPGLDEDALATLATALGHVLPEELKTLLRWHAGQGVDAAGGRSKGKPKPPPAALTDHTLTYDLLSSASIVEIHRKLSADLAGGKLDGEAYTTKNAWDARWIPFARSKSTLLVIDLAGYFGGVAGQVMRVQPRESERVVISPSLTAFVTHHLRMLEAGGVIAKLGKLTIVSRRYASDPDHPEHPIHKRVERNARPPTARPIAQALLDVLAQRMSSAEVAAAIEAGAGFDARDAGGRAPLHLAVQCPQTGPAEAMLRAGSPVDVRDPEGRTPLAFAVELSRVRDAVAMTRLLIGAGADPDLADASGTTPRQRAAQRWDAATRDDVLAALAPGAA